MRESTIRFQPLRKLSYGSEVDNHNLCMICGAFMGDQCSISDTRIRNSVEMLADRPIYVRILNQHTVIPVNAFTSDLVSAMCFLKKVNLTNCWVKNLSCDVFTIRVTRSSPYWTTVSWSISCPPSLVMKSIQSFCIRRRRSSFVISDGLSKRSASMISFGKALKMYIKSTQWCEMPYKLLHGPSLKGFRKLTLYLRAVVLRAPFFSL